MTHLDRIASIRRANLRQWARLEELAGVLFAMSGEDRRVVTIRQAMYRHPQAAKRIMRRIAWNDAKVAWHLWWA